MRRLPWSLSLSLLCLACAPTQRQTPDAGTPEATPKKLVAHIVHTYPHDPTAFTQGLQFHQGQLYESTGEKGDLRRISLEQAEPLWKQPLPDVFPEGLASDGQRLYQLTWQDETLFVWNGAPPAQEKQVEYDGEGWGLCYWQGQLVRSDGTSTLRFHDPKDFHVKSQVQVTLQGVPQEMLNELECAEDGVYANVWHSNNILKIDYATGRVLAVIDASALAQAVRGRVRSYEAVLNGIALEPGTGRLFLTGKLWPDLFEVTLVGPAATP
ncbi:glutaminyl-peptide cyclotransferase [Corallococcus exiguus]|uniref:glutaminyl-peptide cyclotransferase n=1 Tax=Corallococcus exiguus TaxID=83462 RepID=UPI001470BFC1|nr:glutaminyl-peptide cyclotransferase [Corallococcus exiguus]NNB84196.1 glutaminyl-peptide cyclotransferase [Corallococcus exiguus]NNB96005.1 glutaminyl-peptide cyclotransferase [Corallococcus exiguus]NNC04491.1 glutaminyl-peptide cyclotransferase [Corallococcus exiguus]NNC18305.1 glutaminyl-peptide cyclotransferase [Corallococcus exiguus]NRD55886.1 glutaminyl-peptide cyclotransferase [Corallococcus exiguus]